MACQPTILPLSYQADIHSICVWLQAVNKLAEIMNRKEFSTRGSSKKVSATELRKKEKECRKLQQDLTQVCLYVIFQFVHSKSLDFPIILKVCCKNRPPLHVSLNNFVTRPSFKNLRDKFLTKWPRISKVCLHFQCDLYRQNWNSKRSNLLLFEPTCASCTVGSKSSKFDRFEFQFCL